MDLLTMFYIIAWFGLSSSVIGLISCLVDAYYIAKHGRHLFEKEGE